MSARIPLLLLLLLLPAVARADTLYWLNAKLPNGATYPDGGGDPMKYFVDETQANPGGLPVAHVEQEIRDAYQRWQDVDCAYIGFAFQGAVTDPGQLGTHADGKNVMGSFVSSRDDSRYTDDLGNGVAVGVALTYRVNGVIQGCDTEYNSADYAFTDGTPITGMDFPSLANHENGHCLGLDHDPNDLTSVMYPTVNAGDDRRTLDAHDIDNVCQLYPETGALGSPCAGSSCGGGLACIANPTAGGNFCSQACTPTDPTTCPAGFGCKSSTAISGAAGACYPGTGDYSPVVGADCQQDGDCEGAAGLCFVADNGWPGGYCSQICDSESSPCPTGDVCVSGLDPQHFYCMAPCTTYGGGCRDGYACVAYDTGGDGYCFPACMTDANCGSGALCLADRVCYLPGNGGSYVGHACLSQTDCPTGDYCVPATSNGVSTGWPGGYCVAPCGAGQNAARSCGADAACVIAGAEGQAYCLQRCDAHGGCRAGYTCVSQADTEHGTQQVCAPGCSSDENCAVGERCVAGACVDPYAVDAGSSCALCGDGGVQQATTGGGSGGGTGTTGDTPATGSGCGCGAGRALDLPGALGLLALLMGRTRRRW